MPSNGGNYLMTMQKEMFGTLELDKKIVAALTEMGFE